MKIKEYFGQNYEAGLELDANGHTLHICVLNHTTGKSISVYTRDAVENSENNHEQSRFLPGRYEFFNKNSDLYMGNECSGYSDIHLTTTALTDNGESIPGLVVDYCFRLYKEYPVITVTTSFNGDENAYAESLSWLNLYTDKRDFTDFFGVGPDMNGYLDRLERPISFTQGMALSGEKGSMCIIGGGFPAYLPETGQLLPDSRLKYLKRDLRYNDRSRPYTASLMFGPADPDVNLFSTMLQEADKTGLTSTYQYGTVALETCTLTSGELSVAVARFSDGIELLNCGKKDSGVSIKSAPLIEIQAKRLSNGERLIFEAHRSWEKTAVYKQSNGLHIELQNPCEGRIRNFAIVIDVHATKPGRMEWSTSILNDNPDITVLMADYPATGFSGNNIEAFIPANSGEVERDITGHTMHVSGCYPDGGYFTMPYFAFYDITSSVNNGLYVGVHDAYGARKDFIADSCGIAEEGRLCIRFPAVASGRPANSFSLPGVMIWEVFSGDWFDATRIYRQFVHSNAAWLPAVGPEGREDTPEWMRKLPFWIMDWMPNDNPDADPLPVSIRPETAVHDRNAWYKDAIELQKALGVPIGYHVYNWHWIPFNNDFPHYFPTKPGFKEGVGMMQSNNIYVAPYINGRLWDVLDRRGQNYRFETEAHKWATKDADGQLYLESYASHEPDGQLCRLAAMCPGSAVWKTELANITGRLFNDIGVKGVYIDQVAAADVNLCMDESHNHLPGGGDWWVKEYNLLMQRLNMVKPRDRAYITESNAEVYAKSFDAYLTWIWIVPNQVPAFSSIYAGYIAMMGRNTNGHKKEDVSYFKHHVAQQVLYGQQIGWINADVLKHPGEFDYLKKMVQLRYRYSPYFYKGSMLRPPVVEDDQDKIKTFAGMTLTQVFAIPAVLSGAWRLWDGSGSVLFVTNTAPKDVCCTVEISCSEYNITDVNQLSIACGNGTINSCRIHDDKLTLNCCIIASDFLAIEW